MSDENIKSITSLFNRFKLQKRGYRLGIGKLFKFQRVSNRMQGDFKKESTMNF